MSQSVAEPFRSLLSAASFAARAHVNQKRKDGVTPYAAHPFRVCLIVRHVFGVDDPNVLKAALLHDTIEDTTTDRDDLIEQFGAEVAAWVAALSKDKRLPDEERESAYMRTLAAGPAPVTICKLADIFDNLMDSQHLSAEQRRRTVARTEAYLNCLVANLPEIAKRPFAIVSELLAEVESHP